MLPSEGGSAAAPPPGAIDSGRWLRAALARPLPGIPNATPGACCATAAPTAASEQCRFRESGSSPPERPPLPETAGPGAGATTGEGGAPPASSASSASASGAPASSASEPRGCPAGSALAAACGARLPPLRMTPRDRWISSSSLIAPAPALLLSSVKTARTSNVRGGRGENPER